MPSQPDEWSQVVTRSDGTHLIQDLPRPLVHVLENPTPETIRAYFEWRIGRARKILRAAELMKDFRRSVLGGDQEPSLPPGAPEQVPGRPGAPAGPASPEAPTFPAVPPGAPFRILYFHRTGCSPCSTQDLTLSEWMKLHPEGTLEPVEFGSRSETWRAYRVRGTPSLVIEDSLSHQSVFLEGVVAQAGLDRALATCRTQVPQDPASKGGSLK